MARIRTIKPEFWTDEKIVQLPFEARLIFIGMWNFCDDDGYLLDEPERIRLQVLPSDDVDVDGLIDLLVASELLDRLVLKDGRRCLYVKHFSAHQKVSHSTPSRIAPEISGKLAIPSESRRQVAKKYGCAPGGTAVAECYTCGMTGRIWWPNTSKGRPGFWVSFSGLEISHFVAESEGGASTSSNLVLCCRHCNRSMHTQTPIEKVLQKIPEPSGVFQITPARTERNGTETELNGIDPDRTLSGSYEEVDEQMLMTPAQLRRWFDAGKRFGILSSECDELHVFALAELALRKGRKPAAYFVGTIQRKDWKSLITNADEQAASLKVKSLRLPSGRSYAPALQRLEAAQ